MGLYELVYTRFARIYLQEKLNFENQNQTRVLLREKYSQINGEKI